MTPEDKRPRLGPPGPCISDQAGAGSGAAKQLLDDVTLWGDYVANVVHRMQVAVLYGVEVEIDGADDTEGTGMRNLTEGDAGALVGALRTLQQLVAGVDDAVAVVLGQPKVSAIPAEDWPVHL